MSLLDMFNDVGKLFIGSVIGNNTSDLNDIEYDEDFDIKEYIKNCEAEGIINSKDAELLTKTTENSEKRAKESLVSKNSKKNNKEKKVHDTGDQLSSFRNKDTETPELGDR